MCLAEGAACAPGARLPCCRDTDPLQDLQCVPSSTASGSRVCARPPTLSPGPVTAAAAPGVVGHQVTVQVAAPSSTGGSSAGARYEARLSELVAPGRPARGPYRRNGTFGAANFASVRGGIVLSKCSASAAAGTPWSAPALAEEHICCCLALQKLSQDYSLRIIPSGQVTVVFTEGASGVPAGGLRGGTWVASARLANTAGWSAWSAPSAPVTIVPASNADS